MSDLRHLPVQPQVNIASQETIFTVAEYISLINTTIKPLKATIQGEIGKIKYYPKAVYFSLFDKDRSVINCMIWNSRLQSLGIELQDGLELTSIEFALSDYFTCSFTDRSTVGEVFAAISKHEGEDLGKPYIRLLANERKFDETTELAEWHDRAEIWGGAFWAIRARLGRERTDRILVQAWQSMDWPTVNKDASQKFIKALLLATENIVSGDEVADVQAILRKRRFPLPK